MALVSRTNILQYSTANILKECLCGFLIHKPGYGAFIGPIALRAGLIYRWWALSKIILADFMQMIPGTVKRSSCSLSGTKQLSINPAGARHFQQIMEKPGNGTGI